MDEQPVSIEVEATTKFQKKIKSLEKKYRNIKADLYDPRTMPPDLVKAHQTLDKAVDLCYRPQIFINELNRIEFLFGLYETLNTPLLKAAQKKKRSKKIDSKLPSENVSVSM